MRPLIVIAMLTVLLGACGQTGPLYLEKQQQQETPQTEPVQPQPAAEPADAGSATAEGAR